MGQRFIQLGEGYSDFFELVTLIEHMPQRVMHLYAFHTKKDGEDRTSLAASFQPTKQGNFQPIYICLEGIPRPNDVDKNVRYEQFQELAEKYQLQIVEMEVPSSDQYHELTLYFNQLISILRLNHLLPPL
ncbi:methylthioribose kinase [Allobacillus sp. GCM10007491]|uniref:Methylthioribose kinase n=2 Tax=Allobacillus TaxID=1400133 RepID=A0A941HRN1_9BACI|nr:MULTISPECIES: methylthioribose kinase [Allobacillus]MBR7552776.1 methylthioribose kinase [Allobacillus saliphilus]TSJ67045.1 methylthioribose kinase [Allobacillus salarius]